MAKIETPKFVFVEWNATQVGQADPTVSLGVSTVTSTIHCALMCFGLARCLKAVYTGDSQCFLYDYIVDSKLPLPKGSVLIKRDICYYGEMDMGEITFYKRMATGAEAETACQGLGGHLAMPKTDSSFKLLAYLSTIHPGNAKIHLGLRNPEGTKFKYYDGEIAGDIFPIAVNTLSSAEKQGELVDIKGIWHITDVPDNERQEYFCQSK